MTNVTPLKTTKAILGEIPAGGGPFVIIRKKHLEELSKAFQAIIGGENALAKKKTRSFAEFLRRAFPRYAKNK